MISKSVMLAFGAVALLAPSAHAGPCTDALYQADVAINKRLDVAAAQGKSAAQSLGAQLHRQPTPGSIAAAEGKLGDLTDADVAAVQKDMDAARKADAAGDKAGCDKALADVRRILGVLDK